MYNQEKHSSELHHSPTLSTSTRTSSPAYTVNQPFSSSNTYSSQNISGDNSSSNIFSAGMKLPMFQTVLRKKHALRRAHSVNDTHFIIGGVGGVLQQQQILNSQKKHKNRSK